MMNATSQRSLPGVVHESPPECRCAGTGVMLVAGARGGYESMQVICVCDAGRFVAKTSGRTQGKIR